MEGFTLTLITSDGSLPVGLFPSFEKAATSAAVHGEVNRWNEAPESLTAIRDRIGARVGWIIYGWSVVEFRDYTPVMQWFRPMQSPTWQLYDAANDAATGPYKPKGARPAPVLPYRR